MFLAVGEYEVVKELELENLKQEKAMDKDSHVQRLYLQADLPWLYVCKICRWGMSRRPIVDPLT